MTLRRPAKCHPSSSNACGQRAMASQGFSYGADHSIGRGQGTSRGQRSAAAQSGAARAACSLASSHLSGSMQLAAEDDDGEEVEVTQERSWAERDAELRAQAVELE